MLSRGRLSDRRCAAAGLMSPAGARAGTDKYDNVRIGNTIQAAVPSSAKLRTGFFTTTTVADYSR